MKRLFRRLLILTVILCCAATVYAAEPVVQKMNVRCNVDEHGDYMMTVTAEVLFSEPSESVVLPIGTDVRKISVADYRISKETIDGNIWIRLKDSAGLTGTQTFVITYEKLRNVTLGEKKVQTLDVELLCPLWDWTVEKLIFSVTMPEEFAAEPAFISGYHAEQIQVDHRIEKNTIQGTVQEPLLDRESVKLTLLLPKRFFQLQNIPGAADPAAQILMLLLTVLTVVYWYKTLRNPYVKGAVRKLTPDGILAWEFPYILKGGRLDLPLLISEWGSLGYVSLSVTQTGRIRLYSRIPMAGERKPYEVRVYRALFRRDDVCFADTIRFRRIGEKAGKVCRNYWNSRLFTRNSGNPYLVQLLVSLVFGLSWFRAMDHLLPAWTWRTVLLVPTLILGIAAGWLLQSVVKCFLRRTPHSANWLVWPILLATGLLAQFGGGWPIGLAATVLAILAVIGTLRGGKRTEDGLDRIAQIRAFRTYIRQANAHHLRAMLHEDGQYFYDLLPYAEAMDLGKQFAARFGNIPLEPCGWLSGVRTHTAMEFYEVYCDLRKRMQG